MTVIARSDSNSPPARADFGCSYYTPLTGRPHVLHDAGAGHVTLILGDLSSGHEVRIDVTDLAWLDALESAVQTARAEAVIYAGMQVAA